MIENFTDGLSVYLQGSVALSFLAVYLGGVLISFTPCIYPVIPIPAAVIGGQRDISGARGFVLSLFFVLGLALTYSALGVFAALTGMLFGTIQTSPLTLGVLGGLFILMGLAMLDVFQLSLERYAPRNHLTGGNRKGIFGSFMIGVTSGFILGPCTAPVLAVILGVVAARQSVFFGASLLFVFSLGVGSLLVLIGTFAGILASLPKSGAWMTGVKKLSGIVMLAAGAYFLYSAFIA